MGFLMTRHPLRKKAKKKWAGHDKGLHEQMDEWTNEPRGSESWLAHLTLGTSLVKDIARIHGDSSTGVGCLVWCLRSGLCVGELEKCVDQPYHMLQENL